MNILPIEANIVEDNTKIYYQIKLWAVPHVGDQIHFFSYVEQKDGRESEMAKGYEVTKVVHEVRDVTDKVPQSKDGYHFVTVHVRPAENDHSRRYAAPERKCVRN